MHALGIEKSEEELIKVLGAASWRGTWPSDWGKLSDVFGVTVVTGQPSSLIELEVRRKDGWFQSLLITADVPHYVCYLGAFSGDVLVHDPWDTPFCRIDVHDFSAFWQVKDKWTRSRVYCSSKWFVAIK